MLAIISIFAGKESRLKKSIIIACENAAENEKQKKMFIFTISANLKRKLQIVKV